MLHENMSLNLGKIKTPPRTGIYPLQEIKHEELPIVNLSRVCILQCCQRQQCENLQDPHLSLMLFSSFWWRNSWDKLVSTEIDRQSCLSRAKSVFCSQEKSRYQPTTQELVMLCFFHVKVQTIPNNWVTHRASYPAVGWFPALTLSGYISPPAKQE